MDIIQYTLTHITENEANEERERRARQIAKFKYAMESSKKNLKLGVPILDYIDSNLPIDHVRSNKAKVLLVMNKALLKALS